jgi:hypothetical protein
MTSDLRTMPPSGVWRFESELIENAGNNVVYHLPQILGVVIQCGLLFLHCTGLSPATPCRSPGALAYINLRFVKCPKSAHQ